VKPPSEWSIGWDWFSISSPRSRIGGYRVKWYNCFNRRQNFASGGWVWGVGVLQVSNKHLFYVGFQGLCVGFVWWIGHTNGPARWGRELSL